MITIKYLKQMISNVPDDCRLYAYQGEVEGIVVLAPDKWEQVLFIPADEHSEIEDK